MQWPPNMTVRPIQSWPGELTSSRRRAPFRASWSDTIELLRRELRAINARDVVLQVAMQEKDFRIDGYPRAQAKAAHPGVILSLQSDVGPLSWPCDTFDVWQDNIRGIALSMEALRKVDRYGVTKRGEQYTGWQQLPAGGGEATSSVEHATTVIREYGGADVDLEKAYRRAQFATHPDRNGDSRVLWNAIEAAAEVLRSAKLLE
ncbi:molecular chaperone DnaJ [Gordonia terrae]